MWIKEIFMSNSNRKMTINGVCVCKYRIVYGNGCYPSEKTAAYELAKYIELTTSHKLPVTDDTAPAGEYEIAVGKTNREGAEYTIDREKYGHEGYRILTCGTRLVIAGGVERGTMYGVYDFIRKYMNWEFYTPTLEKMKSEDDIVIENIDEDFIPQFEYRDLDWIFARDVVYATKMHLNGPYRKYGKERGGELKWGGAIHSLGSYFEGMDSHKEQPCLTNEDNIQTVIKKIEKYMEEHPDCEIFEISQNDNQNYCKCERCAKLDEENSGGDPRNHSASVVYFINRLAEHFKDKYPKLHFQTFAYQYSRTAPTNMKLADNVIIKLCPMECCYHHPLYDKDCEANQLFCRDLESWQKIAKKIYIWEYSTNYCYFLSPFANLETQRLNMRWYAENNVAGVYPEANYICESGECAELRGFLQAKLMWEPYMTKEEYYAYYDEFLQAYYGSGWKYIKKFLEWVETEAKKNHMDIWAHPDRIISFEVWKPMLKEIASWWDEAEKGAKDDPDTLEHVQRSRLQFTLIELTLTWEERFDGQTKESRDEYRRDCMKFYNTLVLKNIGWREAYMFPPKVNFSAPPLSWCNAHTYGEPETED